jgi:hypothetical protein
LGIYSKKKRKLKLVELDSIFCMNQKVKRIEEQVVIPTAPVTTTTNKEDAAKDYIKNKNQLVKDFGTNKAKKQMSNLRSTIINEDNVSSLGPMTKMINDKAIMQEQINKTNPEQQLESKIEDMRLILPPFDLEAQSVGQIFNQDSSKINF